MGKSKTKLAQICSCAIAATIAFSSSALATTVDVMVLYTDGITSRYGASVDSRINQVISVSNQVYSDSALNLQLRLVHSQKISYTDNNHPQTALEELSCDLTRFQTHNECNRGSAFSSVDSLRDQHGADMVVLMRPYKSAHNGVCGIAWVGGNGTNGDFSNKVWRETAMSVVGLDGPCADWVTSHELGHNMGLTHSSLQDARGGTYSWAWGHGKTNDFATIMGYAWVFGNDTRKAYNFSNPDLDCYGSPCGIPKNQAGAADAVAALKVVAPQIAAYTAATSGGGSDNGGGTPPPAGSPEQLKQIFIQEKETLAALKLVKDQKKQELLAAKTPYKEAHLVYKTALKAYQSALNKQQKYLDKVNVATAQYNASSGESLSYQQKLLAKVQKHTDAYNTATQVVNDTAQQLNAVTPAYQAALNAYNAAVTAFNTAKAAVVDQKVVVENAKQNYINSKA
ncbi:hypothetical protein GCM10011369_04500 [Neiella marina]|uniref:Peptidase M12B domain-containing protein n=1 Tax=Neiella marina TaxID=508461 RepID=A0A8J2U2G5_9GAMM|nr:M12 family metallo-peptidase [Neiella marina]GGA66086.1 hypothetical protein GCM10011369_04500 [Neiella marina]